jgi:hypothetical protein
MRLKIAGPLPKPCCQHQEKPMSIDPSAAASAGQASSAGSVQVDVLKKAVDNQANAVLRLMQSAAPQGLATEGSVGTQVNTHA